MQPFCRAALGSASIGTYAHFAAPIGVEPPMRQRMKPARRSRASKNGAVLTTGVLLALLIWLGRSEFDFNLAFPPRDTPAQSHKGAILLESDSGDCQSFVFDNDSGQITGSTAACDDDRVALGADNKPVPLGTFHRMQAIRKSFQP